LSKAEGLCCLTEASATIRFDEWKKDIDMRTQLNKEKMMDLMMTQYSGNYTRFGRELGIDPGHLYRFLNDGIGGGKTMIFSLMNLCDKNNLDYRVFFDS
jgi:hypothetical protein